jgi:hypothetical protein
MGWSPRRQVWLGRTEQFSRPTPPRADSVPEEVEDHDDLTNLRWHRLDGAGILGVVRGHWGIENHGVRPLDVEWQEEQAWCTKGAASDVLGLWRLWASNLVGLLKGRDLRAACSRALTPASFVAWRAHVGLWREARRHVRRIVPVG